LDDVLAVEPHGQLEAGQSRLGDDHLGGTDAEAVADVNLVLPPAFGREVLAEGAPGKVLQLELAPPERVMLRRVDVDRLEGAAVDGEVRLAVSFQVELA